MLPQHMTQSLAVISVLPDGPRLNFGPHRAHLRGVLLEFLLSRLLWNRHLRPIYHMMRTRMASESERDI
jgi:hypothetical protein